MAPPCALLGQPQYWDTYWWSNMHPGSPHTASNSSASARGFYSSLLANRRWWAAELASEGMHELVSLPSPAASNGTFLATQARHALVKSMVTCPHPLFSSLYDRRSTISCVG